MNRNNYKAKTKGNIEIICRFSGSYQAVFRTLKDCRNRDINLRAGALTAFKGGKAA